MGLLQINFEVHIELLFSKFKIHNIVYLTDLHNFMQLCMFLPYWTTRSCHISHNINNNLHSPQNRISLQYNADLFTTFGFTTTHNSRYYIRNSGKYTFYFSNLIKCLSETHQPLLSNTIYLAHIQDSIKMLGCWFVISSTERLFRIWYRKYPPSMHNVRISDMLIWRCLGRI